MTERTPDGIGQHEAGAKLDAGKPRVGLVLNGFSRAIMEVAKVGTFGANKYTDNGWMEVENGEERYKDALYRHLLKEQTEGWSDDDSKLPHLAHAAWNALAALELAMRDMELVETEFKTLRDIDLSKLD